MSEPEAKASPLMMAATWAVVTIPLAWGIYQTAIKVVPLFVGPTASAGSGPSPAPDLEKPGGRSSRGGLEKRAEST